MCLKKGSLILECDNTYAKETSLNIHVFCVLYNSVLGEISFLIKYTRNAFSLNLFLVLRKQIFVFSVYVFDLSDSGESFNTDDEQWH